MSRKSNNKNNNNNLVFTPVKEIDSSKKKPGDVMAEYFTLLKTQMDWMRANFMSVIVGLIFTIILYGFYPGIYFIIHDHLTINDHNFIGIAGVWTIFLIGVTTGRQSPNWDGWDYVAQPVVLLFNMYWWLICILVGIGLETVSELVLDSFRIEKQFPLFRSQK